MRVPADIARRIREGNRLGFDCQADGTVLTGFQTGAVYPPPGYLPWSILEVGNGDSYGYYWPIGKETDPPLVCTIMHDAWSLVPFASSLPGCIRLLLSSRSDGEDAAELVEIARQFDIPIADISGSDEGDSESEQLTLTIDPGSPQLRLLAARGKVAVGRLSDAEADCVGALEALPEYSDAWALLAQIHRQKRNHRPAAAAIIHALTSPLCFGAVDRSKLLNWLQRMDGGLLPECPDPLWKRRHELTFAEGVKEKDDYSIFGDLIEEYHRLGMGLRAVRLRIVVGELMNGETVSFRERSGWDWPKYWVEMKRDFERAGILERAIAIA